MENIMNLNISIEATCDLSAEIIKEYDFKIINMDFLIDGEVYNTVSDTVISTDIE